MDVGYAMLIKLYGHDAENCGILAMNSPMKVLRSSLWAHHFPEVQSRSASTRDSPCVAASLRSTLPNSTAPEVKLSPTVTVSPPQRIQLLTYRLGRSRRNSIYAVPSRLLSKTTSETKREAPETLG